jgi:uncharacterized protein YoxC
MRQAMSTAEVRKADMNKLADEFEGAVGRIIDTVSAASTDLETAARSLTATAEQSQQLTDVVAAASEHASNNVQSVASATEQMTSSVHEISRQVQNSAQIAREAVEQAQATTHRVGELSKAACRIGDVIELINAIARQTNLLALNASIEAARAGDAGRGFAVVASEVKALAEQAAKATGEISEQVSGIQNAARESATAINAIGGTIGRMSEIASTIAAAVDQQGAATKEIFRNVQQAAQGTLKVSSNIIDVQPRRQRDWISFLPGILRGAGPVRRKSSPQGRRREVPELRARGLQTLNPRSRCGGGISTCSNFFQAVPSRAQRHLLGPALRCGCRARWYPSTSSEMAGTGAKGAPEAASAWPASHGGRLAIACRPHQREIRECSGNSKEQAANGFRRRRGASYGSFRQSELAVSQWPSEA